MATIDGGVNRVCNKLHIRSVCWSVNKLHSCHSLRLSNSRRHGDELARQRNNDAVEHKCSLFPKHSDSGRVVPWSKSVFRLVGIGLHKCWSAVLLDFKLPRNARRRPINLPRDIDWLLLGNHKRKRRSGSQLPRLDGRHADWNVLPALCGLAKRSVDVLSTRIIRLYLVDEP